MWRQRNLGWACRSSRLPACHCTSVHEVKNTLCVVCLCVLLKNQKRGEIQASLNLFLETASGFYLQVSSPSVMFFLIVSCTRANLMICCSQTVSIITPSLIDRGTGYCFRSISLFIYLYLCFFVSKITRKAAGPICMKFSGKVRSDHGTTWFTFGSIRRNCAMLIFLRHLSTYEQTAVPIFMKFSGKVWSDHGLTWFNFWSIRRNRTMLRCATRGWSRCALAPQLVNVCEFIM